MDEDNPMDAVDELLGTASATPEPAPEPAPEPVGEALPVTEELPVAEPLVAEESPMGQDELLQMLSQASPEERAQILADAREAALSQQVAQAIEPYRQQLGARIEAGELSTEAANELLEARVEATTARMEREQAQTQAQQVARAAQLDAFFTQVTSEFPGADVETLKLLSGQGIEPNALRTIAARQSATAKKLTDEAVAKYVAAKTEDGGAFVPAGGSSSRLSGGKVLDEDSDWGSLLGL